MQPTDSAGTPSGSESTACLPNSSPAKQWSSAPTSTLSTSGTEVIHEVRPTDTQTVTFRAGKLPPAFSYRVSSRQDATSCWIACSGRLLLQTAPASAVRLPRGATKRRVAKPVQPSTSALGLLPGITPAGLGNYKITLWIGGTR